MNKPIFENDLYIVHTAYVTSGGSVFSISDKEFNNPFTIYNSPTANCQISSIGNCQGIIMNKKFIQIIESLHDRDYISHQLIVDVHNSESYTKKLDAFDIVFKNPYTSTNGSEMIMYLLRLRDIEDKYDDDDY